ncbi:MSW1 [[Candida] subhashii]|uniref:Tryptophan--tRNA ligase, mitochondrial n=1 Tax=[Candida] subhashii TaxID=561895 RepID=A0A8J5QT20_9ASCO|nr:MSW1 [[Candida] subhashii]KAG7665843.1 MSW1 [[Candida] subhashii]
MLTRIKPLRNISSQSVAKSLSLRYASKDASTAKTVQQISGYEHLPNNSTVFSMIQPTGKFHIGNYLGAIKAWRTLSESNVEECKFIFGVADLHAITIPKKSTELKANRLEAMASILSSGIDPKKCILFYQSAVPEHAELHWYLTCITSMGALNRMTQWKSKQQEVESTSSKKFLFEHTKAGLFCYPVLQAADVLMYNSTHVPVGDDQSQHLELCRAIATSFNDVYDTKFFNIPKTLLTPSQKILSLRNPTKKMSKSDKDQKACVYVTDSPEEIQTKIRKAVTDSQQGPIYFDPVERPGVSNLINIISGISNKPVDEVVKDLEGVTEHSVLKNRVADLLIEEFSKERDLYEKLMGDAAYLEQVYNQGRDQAREIASANIKQIRKLIGMD